MFAEPDETVTETDAIAQDAHFDICDVLGTIYVNSKALLILKVGKGV